MPKQYFIQIVVFTGDCEVKTLKELPKSFVIGKRSLLAYINSFDQKIIQTPVLRAAVKAVENGIVIQTKDVVTSHINMIEKRTRRRE